MDDLSCDQSGGSIFGISTTKKDKLNKLLENIISRYLQEKLKDFKKYISGTGQTYTRR